jgi:hypothetical protein
MDSHLQKVGVDPNDFCQEACILIAKRMRNTSPTELLVRRAGSDKYLRASGRWKKKLNQLLTFRMWSTQFIPALRDD